MAIRLTFLRSRTRITAEKYAPVSRILDLLAAALSG